jgi:hypothetical protein
MSFDVGKAVSELEEHVSSLDFRRLSPAEGMATYETAAKLERLAKALKVSALPRAAEAQGWRRLGFSSVEEWQAHVSGSTFYAASQEGQLAEDLRAAPVTRSAFRSGALSMDAASVIADAAKADPSCEERLVASARSGLALSKLKRRAARIKAGARDPEDEAERQRRHHRERSLTTWDTSDGALDGRFHLPALAGATLLAALEPYIKAAYRQAHAEGRRATREQLMADALLALATSGGQGQGPRPVIHVRVDYEALRRGRLLSGEVCEIEGLGSIPLEVVEEMAGDALLRILLIRGKDVTAVASSRTATPLQKLLLREQADFTCCLRPCSRRFGLEADHIKEWAKGGLTELGNFDLPCGWHHDLKTHHGYQIVQAPDGEWDLVPPEGADPNPRPPPGWDSG